MTDNAPQPQPTAPSNASARHPRRRPAHRNSGNAPKPAPEHPVIQQLGQWYPALFGEQPRPLKRGIFEDLIAAHPEALSRDALKSALAWHTRSTRYLSAVASGLARHDLQGKAVEAVAPEHVLHALLEVFRRRQARSPEDLGAKLRQRIIQAYEASGLTREAYAALLPRLNEATQQLMDAALEEAATRAARDAALLRAYNASGLSAAEFADRYGLTPQDVQRMLQRQASASRSQA